MPAVAQAASSPAQMKIKYLDEAHRSAAEKGRHAYPTDARASRKAIPPNSIHLTTVAEPGVIPSEAHILFAVCASAKCSERAILFARSEIELIPFFRISEAFWRVSRSGEVFLVSSIAFTVPLPTGRSAFFS